MLCMLHKTDQQRTLPSLCTLPGRAAPHASLDYKIVCFNTNTNMIKVFLCIHLDIFSTPYYRSSLIASCVALPSLGWDVLHFSTDVQETPLLNSSSLLTELNPFCIETAYINEDSIVSHYFSWTSINIWFDSPGNYKEGEIKQHKVKKLVHRKLCIRNISVHRIWCKCL